MTITRDVGGRSSGNLHTGLGRVIIALVVVIAAAAIGLLAGLHHRADAQVLTGRAYVGDHQASVRVGELTYGFAVYDNDLVWFDSNGVQHEGGIPTCLQHSGRYAWITFGAVPVRYPDDSGANQVTWVRCTHQP